MEREAPNEVVGIDDPCQPAPRPEMRDDDGGVAEPRQAGEEAQRPNGEGFCLHAWTLLVY